MEQPQHINGHDQLSYEPLHVAPIAPQPLKREQEYSRMIQILATWRDILNARLLALLALSGALLGFGFVMWEPSSGRLWGEGIYAIMCLWPTIILYYRKG